MSAEVQVENEPLCAPLLREAIELREASLVVFRHRLLVELKTDLLEGGVCAYEEDGYVSWQIGPLDGHHVHLSIEKVDGVEFVAEPTSCQGGKLNYTVWFQVAFDAGNPYRDGGYFSVTLNAPYDARGKTRWEVVDPVFELYRAFEGEPWVRADETFRRELEARDARRAVK